nr:MAG TPA: hypothetical protein [Caudoviricetes sp.]
MSIYGISSIGDTSELAPWGNRITLNLFLKRK